MAGGVRFGLFVPQNGEDAGRLRALAQLAERRGFDSLWVYDHLYHYPTVADGAVLEAFTTLSLLAGWTSRIRLGTLVLCDGYRSPALTAKMAATLDVLSGGRLELGYGAGWHEEEHRGYGYDFPPARVRIARMVEGLQVIERLWTGRAVDYTGEHYRLAGAICQPIPLQKPRPPITIGGGGEKLLLRAVARHADVWNYFPVALPEYERKLAVLREHCEREGRDPAAVGQSLLVPIVTADWEKEVRDQLELAARRDPSWARGGVVQGTPDTVVPRLRDYARRGVGTFVLALPDATDLSRIDFIADEILPELS
jgi:F420-dependent oxidoreductase-like protein